MAKMIAKIDMTDTKLRIGFCVAASRTTTATEAAMATADIVSDDKLCWTSKKPRWLTKNPPRSSGGAVEMTSLNLKRTLKNSLLLLY